MESIDAISAKGSKFDEDDHSFSPQNPDSQPPQPQTDPMDLITMDVPLMIRLFELMNETVQDDAELHDISTRILEVSKQSEGPLTMEDYNEILNGQPDEEVTEAYSGKANTKIDLVFSVKPNDPAQALIYLNAKNVPIGEAPAADFKEQEYKQQMQQWITKVIQRASSRFTKKFNEEVTEGGQYSSSPSNSLLNKLEALYGEDVMNDFDSIGLQTARNDYEFKPTKNQFSGQTYYEVFKNQKFMGEFATSEVLRLIKKNEPVGESVNEEYSDNRGEFIVMALPGLFGAPVKGWREMQKYFNGKTPLYVRADSNVDGVIISPNVVDNQMLARATEQDGLWK